MRCTRSMRTCWMNDLAVSGQNCGGQRSEVRGRRSGVRGQRSEETDPKPISVFSVCSVVKLSFMRCLGCQYDLRNLATGGEHRCPECSRAFDPNNSETF